MEHPGRYFENNVCGTASLLRAIYRASIRYFVFSSSCAVYGAPEVLPITERSALNPQNPFGESKLIVERMLRWYEICHGLQFANLRYFNTGAALGGEVGEDWSATLNLIPLVLKAALGAIPRLKVFGTDYPTPDATAVCDYVHVLDLADARIRALEYLATQDQPITANLGTGRGYSVRQVVDTAKHISGVDIPLEYAGRRPGDPPIVYADNSMAREVLKWQPQFGLTEIIQSAWQWHSSHPDGYSTVS